ncbi:AraC family transcriptional regulator [Paenarthrobacter sp. NPDC056912]|uniref:AraC family transcriptional regulator n=1 Tax=Paenarthrobacter sp. NPDC056912 TaxID=3345965 RepID=UPI00366CD77C
MSIEEVAELVRGHGTSLLSASGDTDAVVEACASALRPHLLRVRDRDDHLSAQLDHMPNGALDLSRLFYGADVTISELTPEQEDFIVALPLAGQARFSYGQSAAVLQPGTMAVVSPYRGFTLEIGREFDQLLIRLDRRRVEVAAAALVGATEAAPVHFGLAGRISPGIVGLMHAAIQLSTDANVSRTPRLAYQIEDLLTEALLLGYPSNLSKRLAVSYEPPSTDRVAMAMEYMIANLSGPFPLSAVASYCGVTPRSLQSGFQREVGMSPGEWLRGQRLDRAFAQLSVADRAETTVAAIAFGCGFPHLGDFAARFKRRFGQSPSAVLRSPHR